VHNAGQQFYGGRIPLSQIVRQSRAVHAVERLGEQKSDNEKGGGRRQVPPDTTHAHEIAVADGSHHTAAAEVGGGGGKASLEFVEALISHQELSFAGARPGAPPGKHSNGKDRQNGQG